MPQILGVRNPDCVNIERQIGKTSTVSANWINLSTRHMFRSIDTNAPPPPNYSARPDSALGHNQQFQSEGVLTGNALELTYRGRLTRYLMAGAVPLVQDLQQHKWNHFFPRQQLRSQGGVGPRRSRPAEPFESAGIVNASRWFDVGVILELYSGKPFDITTGADNNHDGVFTDRPAGVPSNGGHGPGYANPDVNLSHTFLLGLHANEPENLRVGLSCFDVLNYPNDLSYTGVITSPFFGHAVAAYPPRRMQISAEFTF